jgi:hypothetical protein
MKKIIIASAVILGVSVSSFAQTTPTAENHGKKHTVLNRTPAQFAEQQTQWTEQKVKMTADQRAKLYDANLECFTKLMELRGGEKNVTPEQNKNVLDARDAKVKTFLSADQYAAFEATLPYKQGPARTN